MSHTTSNFSPDAPRADAALTPKADFKFERRRFHRNVPPHLLIEDLQRVARQLGVTTMNRATYRKHGQYSPVTYPKRFGNWNAALIAAGLRPSRNFRVSAQAVLEDIRRVAQHFKTKKLSGTRYLTIGKYCLPVLYRHFGDWKGAVEAAGLLPAFYSKISNDRLFENLEQIWRRLGRQPVSTEITPPLSKFGITPYQDRFGGFQNAITAFLHHLADHPPTGGLNPTGSLPPPPAPHATSRIVNWRMRYLTLRRDNFKCQACGRSPATNPAVILEVDHKHPWSQGGETNLENLQTLCKACNGGKSNLPWEISP